MKRAIQLLTKNCIFNYLYHKYNRNKQHYISLDQIGRYFGNRDHSTVIHGRKKVDAKIKMRGWDDEKAEMTELIEFLNSETLLNDLKNSN